MLAADLRLESPNPLSAQYFAEAAQRGLKTAQLVEFPTAIFNGELSQLAALNAVTATYPLRGHMRIADAPFGVARPTDSTPQAGQVWLDARIMAQLNVKLGDRLRIGAGSFSVAEVLDYRPDQGTGFVNLAPAALINYDDVAATQLIQPGSRVTHAALFAGSPSQVQEFRDYLKSHKTGGERLREVEEIQPAAELRHRSRQPLSQPGQSGVGAAGGGGRRHGGSPLRSAAYRTPSH